MLDVQFKCLFPRYRKNKNKKKTFFTFLIFIIFFKIWVVKHFGLSTLVAAPSPKISKE